MAVRLVEVDHWRLDQPLLFMFSPLLLDNRTWTNFQLSFGQPSLLVAKLVSCTWLVNDALEASSQTSHL